MGLRSSKLKADAKSKNHWLPVILFLSIPAAIVCGFFVIANEPAPAAPKFVYGTSQQALDAKLRKAGMSVITYDDGRRSITLEEDVAMIISPREAKELAMKIQKDGGGSVSITSPAGQVLAEAP